LDPEQQYNVFRNDRSAEHRAGGVCVFISNRFRCNEIELLQSQCFDNEDVYILPFDIACKPGKYRFILVYRRPRQGIIGLEASVKLCDIMTDHLNQSGPTFILGDLNCPNIDWSFNNLPPTQYEFCVYDFCQSNGFSQCVPEATRRNNTLDVVCTNEPILVSNISVQPQFVNSDHNSVDFEVVFQQDGSCSAAADDVHTNEHSYQYMWAQGDYQAISEYTNNVNWSQLFTTKLTPDAMWSAFCEHLDNAIDLFVPKVQLRERNRIKIWRYPRHIRQMTSRKLAVWRALKANPDDPKLKEKYSKLTADCRYAIKQYEVYKENKVINSNNVGDFYKHVNKNLSSRSKIGNLKTPLGETVETDAEKANVLNNYFSSVCTQDDGNIPAFTTSVTDKDGISNVDFDAAKLIAAVRRIKTKRPTSCGPDGYPVVLLRNTIGSLSQPLSHMFNSFISVGKIPDSWKTAHVTPIYKKGPSSDPANYRPISQTSIYCKLLERVLVADVTAYMLRKGLISKHQHGFINKRSTATNLLESLSDWTFTIDNKLTETVIYVDFHKAFDTVSRSKLKIKMEGYGIRGELLNLIMDFLSNRMQRTRVGNCLSDVTSLTSGVVQGSCIGPLLFLIFINDLSDIFDPQITPKLYADDLKLYTSITSNYNSDSLQQNLDRLEAWANTWQLIISIRKCQTLTLNGRQQATNPTTFNIGSSALDNVNNVLDLGVTVSSDLKFSTHVTHIVRKALTRSNLLHRCFISRDTATLVKAFKVYVRPIVEYCSPVWSPHLIKDIELVESVQRKFTKRLPGLWDSSYADRLKAVGLERLDVRRLQLDLIMTYKIMFGLTYLNFNQFFQFTPNQNTRGHAYKLFVPSASLDARKYFFSNRIVRVWNELSSNTTDFRSLHAFRTSIFRTDFTKYCINLS